MDDRRCEVRIVFADKSDRDFVIPLNLLEREITAVFVDGKRYSENGLTERTTDDAENTEA